MKLARALIRRPRALGAGTAALILGGIGLAGCYTNDEGVSPPTKSFYYPTGLVISPGRNVLYVANSDFDLLYNGGTVQALDLARLREDTVIPLRDAFVQGEGVVVACKSVGSSTNAEPVLYPGPCAPINAEPLIQKTAIIGAFASGLVLTHPPSESGTTDARLFVPVRGDPSVTFLDVVDDRSGPCGADCFRLDCGATGGDERCASDHRIGEVPSDDPRHITLPLEPIGIAVDPTGKGLVVAHQSANSVSLISNLWSDKPTLDYVRSNLPEGPTELAALPPALLIESSKGIAYEPGFLLTFRYAPELDLIRFSPIGSDSRPFLTVAGTTGISIGANGVDSRGIAVDSSARKACEEGCGETPGEALEECLAQCVAVPLRMYIAHRLPSSLLIGEVKTTLVQRETSTGPADKWSSAFETMTIRDTAPLAAGPSRVTLGHVVGKDGALHLRVFTAAFDSGLVFSYDPEARRIDAVIHTGRGPHALAFDTFDGTREVPPKPSYSFMYVGHFTDSYIGVVDLDMSKPNTFGSMIITLGTPVPPRGSQ